MQDCKGTSKKVYFTVIPVGNLQPSQWQSMLYASTRAGELEQIA